MVEDCQALSIYEDRVKELLKEYHPALEFKLVVTVLRDGVKDFEQDIFIGRTPTRYGGYRLWFSCNGCHRKTARLFLTPRGDRFRCRKCHNLIYRSQKKHKSFEEKFFRQFTRSNREAWQLRDSCHEPNIPRNHKKGQSGSN